MGLLGGQLGELGGRGLGEYVGGKYFGDAGKKIGGDLGSQAGKFLGSELIPFKKGGRVKKTGMAMLHKGEIVVPAKYAKDVSKSLKDKIKKNGGRNM